MTDNQLIVLFLSLLKQSMFAAPYTAAPYNFASTNFEIVQDNQPTQQGVTKKTGVYFSQLPGKAYGFLKRNDVWNADTEVMVHTEEQWYEAPFQFMALSIQNPSNTTQITAMDIIRVVQQIIHSDTMRVSLNNAGVGIYRTTDIRDPVFLDDYDRYEYGPSFDVTFTYKNIVTTSSNVIESVNTNDGIHPVL